ncbi:small ribosomal subunit biogenesis GTPase RsgA [Synechococcus elongatus]|uniref:Small ribosomal subunit biogenesis GTPase RsgA n=1 Tax=Synechococcus elongatus PCC 11802 TaxID=2283154 RepID=A0AAT9K0U1_SYNEL|nr:small ribosomal subunit biogenesis GTPase RsgA [Synechococcus elongatus]QFZ91962.1 small ribosomal subunit biogenesis GTPase RsgA [Synechococcus elongatus PCC 11802]
MTTGLAGTVVAVQANFYRVQLHHPPADHPALLLCTRRSRLLKTGQRVMVGDRVWVEEPDWQGQRGAIAAIEPRKSELDRPAIANVDQILLVFAVAEPELDPLQLSRFLITAESTGIQVQLCLSKCDLVTSEAIAQWQSRLDQWGYQPLWLSQNQPERWPSLLAQLTGRTTVVAGPSGVGKSSLINRLIPDLELRTAKVSGKLGRGRHTTRHVELFELPQGGLLADSPGFNQPDLTCSDRELAQYFPEIRQRLTEVSCQFQDCRHLEEPGCCIRGDWERYAHYQSLLEEAIAQTQQQNRSNQEEVGFKRKSADGGKLRYEPKLQSRRYRRDSRRSQHQTVAEALHNAEIED